jgi:hypothetical protein
MLSDIRGAKDKGGKQPNVNHITADIHRRLRAGPNAKKRTEVLDMVEAGRGRQNNADTSPCDLAEANSEPQRKADDMKTQNR